MNQEPNILDLDEEEVTVDTSDNDTTLTLDDDDADANSAAPCGKSKKPSRKINPHLVLIAVILLIAAFSVYRLVRWNQGTAAPEDDVPVDTSQFDVETLDMIIPMDSSRLAGREDDGVTTILCLGNNPFADDRGYTGLANKIAMRTNAVVYDCSFPYSSAACKYAEYNPEYTKDHFNFYYVVECFRNNEFKAINSIAGDEPDPRYQEGVDVMKTVDMDKVDILIVMYDSSDYNNGTPSDNPDNPYDVTAFTGGLRVTLNNIQSTWPHIRIFVMSPTYAQYMDEEGNLYNGTTKDLGNGTLNHYLVKQVDAAMDCGVSIIDNYYGTINEDNFEEYMVDHMHYNEKGRDKLADRIAEIINTRMGTVSSSGQ